MSRNCRLSEERKVCAFLVGSLFFMSVIGSASVYINSDLNPPSWRGQDGSTFARWEFSTDVTTTPIWDDGLNPYGRTSLEVFPVPGHDWIQELDGAIGVWPLSGRIEVSIDNRKTEGPEKWIQIQLIWKEKWSVTTPSVSITDDKNVTMANIVPTISIPLTDRPSWTYSVYDVKWQGNPFWEKIDIHNDIYVDALVIDTICIPEPSTYCILAAGAVFFYRIRKWSL
jgi:hypothetical protein